MRLSRNQIEILVIGTLIFAFLLYNFGGFSIMPLDDNENAVPITNAPINISDAGSIVNATNLSANTYSAYGVSFNYPNMWSVYVDNGSGGEVIVAYNDEGTQFQVQIMPNNGISEQESIDSIKNGINIFGWWDKISNTTLTVNNKTAYKDTFIVYSLIPPIIDGRFEQVYFVKNNKTYLMLFQTQNKDFDKEKPNFDIILNSFKVQ